MLYYENQPERFKENQLVDSNPLEFSVSKEGHCTGYRTDYSDVQEIVDRKHWVPSTVAVSQVGKHPSNGTSMYDSPGLLKSPEVARLNASIRHPSNDIVETTSQLSRLKKLTIEVANDDLKSQVDKIQSDKKSDPSQTSSVPNNISTPPDSTIGG